MSRDAGLHKFARRDDQPHTHTKFNENRGACPLSIPRANRRQVHEALVRSAERNSPECVTEKVVGRFRMFADLDFNAKELAYLLVLKENVAPSDRKQWISNRMKRLAQIYQEVVGASLAEDGPVSMIVATRLPYKVHLYFPEIIVDTKGAKAISSKFRARFKAEYPDMYSDEAVDDSVYTSGLRMLYSEKGSMGSAEKRKEEKKEHENLFGAGTYCAAYHITSLEDWKQKTTRSVADLELCSIIADEGAELTPLKKLAETGEGGAVAKGKRKAGGGGGARVVKAARGETPAAVGQEVARISEEGDDAEGDAPVSIEVSEELKEYLVQTLEIEGELATGLKRGNTVVLPSRSRKCSYAKREHQGNHIYVVLSSTGAELRCHNATCQKKKAKRISVEEMPGTMRSETEALLGGGLSEEAEEQINSQIRDLAARFPQLDVSEISRPERSNLDSTPCYLTRLPRNRYCLLCRAEHETSLNCVLTTMEVQKMVCQQTMSTMQFPIPPSQGTTIFANIKNLNVNVTVKGDDNTLRDFGQYESFPQIYEDQDTNLLCFDSLSGRTRAVARYMQKLMQGRYAFQNDEWMWFEGKVWRQGVPPDDLMDTDMTRVYYQLMEHYTGEKQTNWLRQIISEMGSLAKRKIYIEDLERECRKQRHELPFDKNVYLLGFENGVFDARDGTFRPHSAENYLTRLLPYDLPTQSDPVTRSAIQQVIKDIMPDDEVREFLLLTLALNLEGLNRHNMAMVWTGSGGNGKGILKLLMQRAFCDTHHEPPATFLTSERPSADKPAADLVGLEHARSVFCSEPENGRKANSGFVKYITGNDVVNVRNVHEKVARSYRPRFLITLLCNAIPLFQGAETEVRGLWRRLKIIKFEMEFVEHPQKSYERKLDHQLEERTESWGPEFMLMLIEQYRAYIANGRQVAVPDKVQANLEEQKEENDPFPNWFEQNLQEVEGSKVHVHAVTERFNASQLCPKEYKTSVLAKRLRSMSLNVTTKGSRVSSCHCGVPNIALEGYQFKTSDDD